MRIVFITALLWSCALLFAEYRLKEISLMADHYKWFEPCVPHWLSAIELQKKMDVAKVVQSQVKRVSEV